MRRPPLLHALPPLLSREQALASLTRHQVQGCVERGDLNRLRQGLYAVGAQWDPLAPHERHRLLAATAAHRDARSALSHVSAALVWGLPNPRGQLRRVEMTVTEQPRISRAASPVHLHRARLPDRHLRTLDDLRVTSAARTVVDCFRSLRLADAVAIGDAALRRGLTCLLEIEDVLEVQRRWPFVGRAWLGIPLLDPRRENWLESYSAATLFEEGIPLATPQVSIYDLSGRFVARVDALWEADGIVGEADGGASTSATSTPWAIARQKRWPVGCWPPVRARPASGTSDWRWSAGTPPRPPATRMQWRAASARPGGRTTREESGRASATTAPTPPLCIRRAADTPSAPRRQRLGGYEVGRRTVGWGCVR